MRGALPAEVSIRVATPADRVAVDRVLDGALLEVEALDDRLAEGCVLVATAREAVVGAIVLAPEGPTEPSDTSAVPREWPAATHVRAIAVRRKRRHDGIGTGLVRAASRRWAPLVADFDAEVRPFYEALGATCRQDAEGRHWALLEEP